MSNDLQQQDAQTPAPESKPQQPERIIRFMRFRKPMAIFSLLVVLIGIYSLATKGLNLGLDFTGGVAAEVSYSQPVQQADIQWALVDAGFKDPIVQYIGTQRDVMIRMPVQEGEEDLAQKIQTAVTIADNTAVVEKVDAVGSQLGSELYTRSVGALALALIMMLIYVSIRYEFKLAVGAVISLAHDTLFTIGIFSLMGWPFDLTVLAAVLALIGYSLNDTIVVFDRIRENFRKIRGAEPTEIVDIALTETLRRTIMTVGTVLVVVIAMYFLGGDGLYWFSVALLVGLFAGTYSSIYIATAYALAMGLSRKDFVVVVKPEFEEEQEVVFPDEKAPPRA
ncbi:MAG: protein translocase subunit SecF [Pseudomonadota bacterium]|nr:protein translocase subunit SecF [Pseudomonadota bacterium]